MLTRLFLVAAMVLIFAGLHNSRNPLVSLRNPNSSVYTWIDPTVSMEYSNRDQTLRERALVVRDSFLQTLPSTVKHFQFLSDQGVFREVDRADQIAATSRFGPCDLEKVIDAYLSEESHEQKTLVLFSDFQKTTTDVLDSLSGRIENSGKSVLCVSFSPLNPYNYALRVVGARSGRNRITAMVNAGSRALDSSAATVSIGALRVGQKSVALGVEDSGEVVFDIPSEYSQESGIVSLQKEDPLPFDNQDYFSSQVKQNRKVLVVGNIEQNKVITAALKAAAGEVWDPIAQKDLIDLAYDDLNSADLIIINSLVGRSRILEAFFSGGAASNKGIILCLDPDLVGGFTFTFLKNNGLIPRSSPLRLNKASHPVVELQTDLWRGFPSDISLNASIYRYFSSLPGTPLLRMDNSSVLASVVPFKTGKIVLTSTPVGICSSNNLVETGFYIPFMDRISAYSLAENSNPGSLFYAGYPFRNPYYGKSQDAILYTSDGKQLETWSNRPFVSVEAPGIYKVSSSGAAYPLVIRSHPSESEIIYTRPVSQNINYFKSLAFLEEVRNLSRNTWTNLLWFKLGMSLILEVLLWSLPRSANVKK